jgi:outer membrane receptor protein involved in Fe transport
LFLIENADEARTYGLELDAAYQVNDRLRVFGALGLLQTELVEFSASADPNEEGREFAFAPPVTASVGLDYEIIDNLRIGGRARYSAEYFSDNSEGFEIDAYSVLDLQASYTFDNVEIYGYVNNVTDEFYMLQESATVGIPGAPRQFGLGMRVAY